jgi:hypothetical protein
MMSSVITALSLAAILAVGMALALTKFCFVVTVLGARSGNLSPARCVVGLSFLIALSFVLLAQWQGGETMPIYNPRLSVVFGGLVFGLAARANGGCFVGTINGLCKGESRRLFTIAGWILGYALLRGSPIAGHHQTPLEVGLVVGGLGLLLLALNRRATHQQQPFVPNPSEPGLQGTVAWALMLTTGILVGLLHHSGLPWAPSSLAKALGGSLRGSPLTAISAYALLIPIGMTLVHGLRRDFSPVPVKAKDFKLLPLGMLMAMGSVWGMGANDAYLFRYLPLGSMHAALGLTAMAVGILLGDWLGAISPTRNPRTQAGR